jgi:hypothetical protein
MWAIPEWALGVAIIVVAVQVGKSLTHLISGSARRRAHPGSEPAQLEALEDVQRRLGELEERMDFAERLLAQQRDAERLNQPPR